MISLSHEQSLRPAMGRAFTAEEPVAALARHALAPAFVYWRGASGKRYLHKVYPWREWAGFECANIMRVGRRQGARRVLWVGQTGAIAGLMRPGDAGGSKARLRADELSADEVHVHLLARTRAERDAVERDLRAAQALAVNEA